MWAITSVGRCTASITPAIVIVLPVPVAPSSVWKRSPVAHALGQPAIAFGWSAVGVKTESSLKSGIAPYRSERAGAVKGYLSAAPARAGMRRGSARWALSTRCT